MVALQLEALFLQVIGFYEYFGIICLMEHSEVSYIPRIAAGILAVLVDKNWDASGK